MELVIDRGVKSYDVKDVDGTLLGVIKINPADIGISGRFVSARNGIGDGLFAQVVNIRNKRARGKMLDKSEQEFARENAAVIKIHAAESAEDKAEKERLLDLLGR